MNGVPVLFLPIVEWEFRAQRPQHLARCFARAGYRVYYPDLRLSSEPPGPRLVESGVWRLALAGDPAHNPYRECMCPSAVEHAVASLRALSAEHPLAGCWIVAQLPSWRPLAEAIRTAFSGHLMFDCLDEFGAFADHADLTQEETALARTADLVVATTELLRSKLAALGPPCVLVRNGCETAHFGPVAGRIRLPGPVLIGFFGGIHDWFDGPLVAELARTRPDWEFWLIGDTYLGDIDALRSLDNVRFLGELPYADLPRVISHFDVGIIPFKDTPLTRATETIKVYEMLAGGLPVVASDLPELRRLAPMVRLARSAGDFAAGIEQALLASPAERDRRMEFARSQSWLERFLDLRRAMDEACDRKIGLAISMPPRMPPDGDSLGLRVEGADLDSPRDRLQEELGREADELERVTRPAPPLNQVCGSFMAPNLAPIDVDELLDDIRRQIGESWHEDEGDAVQLHLRDVKLPSSSDNSFNEDDYLYSNPDVSVAVQRGDYESGYEHWLKYGRNEGRTLRGGPLNNGLRVASNPNATVGEPIESGQTKERPEARISNYISRRRELDRELQEQLFEIGTSIKTLGEILCRRSREEADLLEALLQAREDRRADDTGPEVNHAEYRND